MTEYAMNIWQKNIVELLAKVSYHCIVYTNVQSIITLKINLIILS